MAIYVECSSSQLFNDEEAVKRSKKSNGFNAVGISYDNLDSTPSTANDVRVIDNKNPTQDVQATNDDGSEDDYSSDDEPFVPSSELELPDTIAVPPSMKQAAVIEKTAYFVARQGPQMEIVLKTKQANNPSFMFLTMGNVYNPYFKYVLRQIKMGRYHPQLQMLSHVSRNRGAKKTDVKEEEKKEYNLNLPKVSTSGTSYAKLINRFKQFNKNTSSEDKDSTKSVSSPMTNEISSEPDSRPDSRGITSSTATEEPKTSEEVNAEHKAINNVPHDTFSATERPVLPEGPVPNQVEDPEGYARYYEQWQTYYHWYYQYYSYPENHEQGVHSRGPEQEAQETAAAGTIHSRLLNRQVPDVAPPGVDNVELSSIVKDNNLTSATTTSINLSESTTKSQVQYSEPSDALRPIIDKMAEYVARNGVEFEAMVRVKNDPRFQFLDASHPCHAYYQKHRRECELAIAASQAKRIIEQKRRQMHEELAYETQISTSEALEAKSTPAYSIASTENIGEGGSEMEIDDDVKKSPQTSISFQFKKESVIQKTVPLNEEEDDDYGSKDMQRKEAAHGMQGNAVEHSQHVEEKEEGEISPSADDCVDEVERKLANKLAAAAREKLARVNRESLMQAERKKRAAAFMAKVKATEISSSLASRIEKKRRAEEEREKEKEKERAAVALEIANRSKEKSLPAAYSSMTSVVNRPIESASSRSLISRTRSPEPSRRSHHRRDRNRDRDVRRRSRSRSRDRREHHHRSSGRGHSRRHERR